MGAYGSTRRTYRARPINPTTGTELLGEVQLFLKGDYTTLDRFFKYQIDRLPAYYDMLTEWNVYVGEAAWSAGVPTYRLKRSTLRNPNTGDRLSGYSATINAG